jgi:hypothetical protein
VPEKTGAVPAEIFLDNLNKINGLIHTLPG